MSSNEWVSHGDEDEARWWFAWRKDHFFALLVSVELTMGLLRLWVLTSSDLGVGIRSGGYIV